ncbi:MAG TPA: hypothetical protein VH475_25980 [Tepidisphaeraceae bacterium]|jgi:hypothetical protein
MSPLRRYWPILACLAGLLLILFELRQAHGRVTADNAFWLFLAALIITLALIDLFQKPPPSNDHDNSEP